MLIRVLFFSGRWQRLFMSTNETTKSMDTPTGIVPADNDLHGLNEETELLTYLASITGDTEPVKGVKRYVCVCFSVLCSVPVVYHTPTNLSGAPDGDGLHVRCTAGPTAGRPRHSLHTPGTLPACTLCCSHLFRVQIYSIRNMAGVSVFVCCCVRCASLFSCKRFISNIVFHTVDCVAHYRKLLLCSAVL